MIESLLGYLTPGSFLYFDLLAAFTNALNGAIICQRPDYHRGRHITIAGILVFAAIGGLDGSVTRDALLNVEPGSLTNPWYIVVAMLAGVIGILTAWRKGQRFRETYHQLMVTFSLPWYAVVGVEGGLFKRLVLVGVRATRRHWGYNRWLHDQRRRQPSGQIVCTGGVVCWYGRADLT
jgi:uncharacterized membrane protein YeiH